MAKDGKIICTSCGKEKLKRDFYQSQNKLHRYFGLLHICKDCTAEVFEEQQNRYSDEKTCIYYFCKKLDLPYMEGAYEGAANHSEKTGWRIYQSYFKQLNSFKDANSYMCSFEEGEHLNGDDIVYTPLTLDVDLDKGMEDIDVKIFWGHGFDEPDDYDFLEIELANWKKTHKCDNQAEITLLREICIKILEIRKLRELKKSVSKEQKELQELMKTASVDPAKSNAINSGENVDRFGVWLKDIEQTKPAEWWENQEMYKDMDGFMPYIKDYIVRPIKNFFTGSKDFFISGEDLSFTDKDGEDDE